MRKEHIEKTCQNCKSKYTVTPSRAGTTKFCSSTCRNNYDRVAERRDVKCKSCDKLFVSIKEKGVHRKFCSRSCFLDSCIRPEEKECATCGNVFLAIGTTHKSEDGRKKYCSKKCQSQGISNSEELKCANCGISFILCQSKIKTGNARCCSKKCQNEYYTGANNPSFKGGVYINRKEKFVLMPREGYAGNYIGEHRIIASKAIGRMLKRGEFVIRLNRDPNDNRPENLFICESNSEFSRRRNGSLPWPSESNLKNYSEKYSIEFEVKE